MSAPEVLFPGFKVPPNDSSREVARPTLTVEREPLPEVYEFGDNFDDEEVCDCCGGDGIIEYLDHPEVWGEDCPSFKNHLLPCPECRGI